jgi:O-methyltransferase
MLTRAKRLLTAINDQSVREEIKFSALRRIAAWLLPWYRLQFPQIAWWRDETFNRYLRAFNELSGMNMDRRWALYQLARLVVSVPGDTAECGVFEGAGSYLIARSLSDKTGLQRTHFMFDSFEGLSRPEAIDGSYWTTGALYCPLDKVKVNLRSLENLSWHKGWIPERFGDVADRRFSFVHIDVDLYQPTRDSMAFFYPRMNDGGIIICDDYGFTSCPGATHAVDEVLSNKPEKMIALPSGGGFFIKGCKTANRAEI